MAIRPDWNIGKINLVAGSAEFATVNAMLNMSAVEPGDVIITPSGHILVIKEITGANSGTLMLPCPAGAAGTGMPLRIRFQPDGSRLAGALRSASALLSGGNVEALAGLIGQDGKIPIFTGAGTMGLADFKATETAINNRVRFDAAQDLNASQQNQARQNINALGRSGGTLSDQLTFKFGDGTYNIRPISFGWGNKQFGTWGVYLGKDNNLSFGVDNPDTGGWIRGVLDLTENGYAHFPNMPIANGSPIVQRGSNANGEFVRFADGTQICFGSGTLTYAAPAYLEKNVTYASVFNSNPDILCTPRYGGEAESGMFVSDRGPLIFIGVTRAGSGFRNYVNNASPKRFAEGNTIAFCYIAIGRWF